MAENRFSNHAVGRSDPAIRHKSITPHDTNEVDPRPRALRIGGAGDITLVDDDGTAITYTVVAGEVLSISPKIVKDTGTDATGIVGWS